MTEFTIEVASVPHRDELVAELWLGTEQVAELSQDGGALTLQMYPPPSGRWEFEFESFLAAVTAMRTRLLPPG